jgi:hypothetical protein
MRAKAGIIARFVQEVAAQMHEVCATACRLRSRTRPWSDGDSSKPESGLQRNGPSAGQGRGHLGINGAVIRPATFGCQPITPRSPTLFHFAHFPNFKCRVS